MDGDSLLYIFGASWLAFVVAAHLYKQSAVIAFGGGFIASCLLLIVLAMAFPSDEIKAREAAEASSELARCRADLQCWSDKHIYDAVNACRPRIENLAATDFRWDEGVLTPKLRRSKWADQKSGSVTYFGDAIQYQNGLGAWVRHLYSCTYDPATRKVLDVRAEPGRIPS
ncbi:MAG: hypothetical protein AB1450_08260 [Pseudomonadota bacterium]